MPIGRALPLVFALLASSIAPATLPSEASGIDSEAKCNSSISDYNAVVTACEEALKAEPKSGTLNGSMGRALYLLSMYDKAIPYLKVSSDQGYSQAMYILAGVYLEKSERFRNPDLGQKYLNMAADAGYSYAQYSRAVVHYENFKKTATKYEADQSVYWFGKAAAQGEVDSQVMLGSMYEFGIGVPVDFLQAAYWYNKAATQGEARAQGNLAAMYFSGRGVEQNESEAFRLVQLAAKQGHVPSQYRLGLYFLNGWGTSKNQEQAFFWLKEAAGQGSDEATTLLAELDGRGSSAAGGDADALVRGLMWVGQKLWESRGTASATSDQAGPEAPSYDPCAGARDMVAWSGDDEDVAAAVAIGGCSPY